MKTISNLLLLITFSFLFLSCSPKIVGTWTVQRYENTRPGSQGTALMNIGTMTFNKDGSGEKNLKYRILGNENVDQIPFKWVQHDEEYMRIESDGSEFSKTWIILENKKKSQKWKSTDGSENVQILELKK